MNHEGFVPTVGRTLVVFLDGSNDSALYHMAAANILSVWKTSVTLGEGPNQYLPRVPEAPVL